MVRGGYMGRIAYVDLTAGKIEIRQSSTEDRRRWIGGSGLSAKIFTDECLNLHRLAALGA